MTLAGNLTAVRDTLNGIVHSLTIIHDFLLKDVSSDRLFIHLPQHFPRYGSDILKV